MWGARFIWRRRQGRAMPAPGEAPLAVVTGLRRLLVDIACTGFHWRWLGASAACRYIDMWRVPISRFCNGQAAAAAQAPQSGSASRSQVGLTCSSAGKPATNFAVGAVLYMLCLCAVPP